MSQVKVAAGPDQGMVWHCGDPLAEQRGIRAGRGVLPLPNRAVFEVSGDDRLAWLHSLTTRTMTSLRPGEACDALVLCPKGRIEYAFHGVETGEHLLAWSETGPQLVEWLSSMRCASVEVRLRDDLQLVWAASGAEIPALAVRDSEVGGGREFFCSRATRIEASVGVWAHEALRIEAGIPRIGVDTDDLTLPSELGFYATDLDKDCYCGQESVASVHNLGRPLRRLVLLHVDGGQERLPESDAKVFCEDQEVGFVGSAAYHYELGGIALALVNRSTPGDVNVLADGIPAGQEALVDPG